MKLSRSFAAVLIACAATLSSFAASVRPEFRHITSREGLGYTWIRHIMRDSRDYMWFSSIYGAHRYDGHSFSDYYFHRVPGSSPSAVSQVYETADSLLWFSTSEGLYSLDRRTETREYYLDSLYIHSVVETAPGVLWVAANRGLFRREGADFKLVPDAAFHAVALLGDSRGALWAGTGDGRLMFSAGADGRFSEVTLPQALHSEVQHLMEDRDHNIWLCTSGSGAARYNLKTGEVDLFNTGTGHIENNLVRDCIQTPDGAVWLGTEQGIVRIFPDGTSDRVTAGSGVYRSLNDNAIYSLCCDVDANVWVGTFFGGVNVQFSGEKMFSSILSTEAEYASDSKVVSDIIPWEGGLMVATENDGVFIIGPDSEVSGHFIPSSGGFRSENVHSLCSDSAGNLWVGTYYGGLYLRRKGRTGFEHFTSQNSALTRDNIYCVREDSRGNLWIGTQYGGLYRYTGGRLVRYPEQLPERLFVWDILEDALGDIWLACYGSGIWRLSAGKGYAPEFIPTPVHNCISLCELNDGRMLAGTEKEGLLVIDPHTLSARVITRDDGLPDATVYSVLQDASMEVWMSTNNGLVRSPEDLSAFTSYTPLDGLPAHRFNYNAHLSMDGRLLFGSTNGLVSVLPGASQAASRRHDVRFTALYVAGSPVKPGDKLLPVALESMPRLVIPYKAGSFGVDFSGNIYAPGGETFRYRMSGADGRWHSLGSRNHVDFPGLPPGRYLLEVEASCEGRTSLGLLPVRISPLWWQSTAAKVLFSLLGVAMLLFVIWLFYQSTARRHELEMERLEREKEREINAAKLRFIVSDPIVAGSISDTDGELLREITDWIIAHLSEPEIDVGAMCAHVGMSRSSLYRKMKALTGKSASEFIQSIRLKYAANLLSDENKTMSEVAYEVGFTDPYYFSRVFKKVFGVPPTQWRLRRPIESEQS